MNFNYPCMHFQQFKYFDKFDHKFIVFHFLSLHNIITLLPTSSGPRKLTAAHGGTAVIINAHVANREDRSSLYRRVRDGV